MDLMGITAGFKSIERYLINNIGFGATQRVLLANSVLKGGKDNGICYAAVKVIGGGAASSVTSALYVPYCDDGTRYYLLEVDASNGEIEQKREGVKKSVGGLKDLPKIFLKIMMVL